MKQASSPPVTQLQQVHFCGIKGVGMAAAAACLDDLGIQVTGTDVSQNFVTAALLKQRSFKLNNSFDASGIPLKTQTLIYTAAHGGINNPQVKAALSQKIPVLSQAELVGQLMQAKSGISVCGVGGKSTISAMLAHIFHHAGYKPSYLVGVGQINTLEAPGKMDSGPHFIAEADEYVVSPGIDATPRFMFQTPQTIICTNILHDHPDVYPNFSATSKAFLEFFAKLSQDGQLIINADHSSHHQLNFGAIEPIWYGLDHPKALWRLKKRQVASQLQHLTITHSGKSFKLQLPIPGEFNALNALAAFAAAFTHQIDPHKISASLSSFTGTLRRFQNMGQQDNTLLYDDYAHHPDEIKAILKAVKEWFPTHKLVAVFQPHTYSRTKALLSQFTHAFNSADQVYITDIFASAREKPDPTINSSMLAEKVSQYHSAAYLPSDQVASKLKSQFKQKQVIITLGAGDIYHLHGQLLS
jgi:UDP-N-acetylmuramate--alanine ligase